MTNPQAHIESVYMCFLPFQYNQWQQTGIHWIDEQIERAYHNKEKELDVHCDKMRLIGIAAGNPKRYTTEDELLLHDRIMTYPSDIELTADLSTLAHYMDVSGLYWTIKNKWPHAEVLGYHEELPEQKLEAHELSEHEMYQMLPLTYYHHKVKITEWRTDEHAKQVVIVLHPDLFQSVLLAATADTVVLTVEYEDQVSEERRIARNGKNVTLQSVRLAILDDLIHYGLQYNTQPVVLEYLPEDSQKITFYGMKRPSSAALRYRMQNPHYQLFASKYRQSSILSYDYLADQFGETFTIAEMTHLLPLKYQVELIREIITVDKV
ncbi:hypothetical protein [Macrococcus brunensis]|uniref:hypothetical protein n=1 Tax=Macrococcus brunensis TaxID=198483 RepID=UPI001EEF7D13|nr:hypothetical protein [Macrococcus brunensis]ULG74857.1 hypothetical protein MGG13_03590 [Macrococcus brunensis]